jgi:uncharacterized membrane protein YeiH
MLHGEIHPLIDAPVLLPALFDYIATFIWATSGALIAARRGFVGIGIFVIAIASATGGGLIRDGLLLPFQAPMLLRNPVYIMLPMAACFLVMIGGRYVERLRLFTPALHLVDALGAGAYAVVGANFAIRADLPLLGVITVGVINAVGGGLLRDILMRRVPDLFKPGLPLGASSLFAATQFELLAGPAGIAQTHAALIAVGTVLLLNLINLRYHVRTRPLETFREYWDND